MTSETRLTAYDLRPLPLFDGLSEAQLERLAAAGSAITIEPGVVLFGEGEPADAWWALLEGAIDLVRHVGREDTVVARFRDVVLPQLAGEDLAIAPLLVPDPEHGIPDAVWSRLHADFAA